MFRRGGRCGRLRELKAHLAELRQRRGIAALPDRPHDLSGRGQRPAGAGRHLCRRHVRLADHGTRRLRHHPQRRRDRRLPLCKQARARLGSKTIVRRQPGLPDHRRRSASSRQDRASRCSVCFRFRRPIRAASSARQPRRPISSTACSSASLSGRCRRRRAPISARSVSLPDEAGRYFGLYALSGRATSRFWRPPRSPPITP